MSLANEPTASSATDPLASTSVDEMPALVPAETCKLNAADPNSLALDQLTSILFSVIVSLALLIGVLIWALIRGTADVWFAAVSIVALLLVVGLNWLSLVWPKWHYAASRWRLDDRGFEVRKGVFWRHQITVPAARVQHVDVSQGPLQRRYGLASLTIHTAGTQNESVSFEGLAHAVALELKDRLIVEKEARDVL